MASTKIIIATVPKSDQIQSFKMLAPSRKAEILQQMAAAADAQLGLQSAKSTSCDADPPRKRQRLTHLSPEEKMMRRKLKNRVAAQTARDRKKAQMDDLEGNLGVLDSKNKQLQLENSLLRKRNEALVQENKLLKERLQANTEGKQSVVVLDHGYCMDSTNTTPIKEEADIESPESAALNAPPQQELTRFFLALMSMVLTWGLTTSSSAFLASSTRRPPAEPFSFSETTTRQEEPLCLVTRKSKRNSQDWWGPQQQSWNPSKN